MGPGTVSCSLLRPPPPAMHCQGLEQVPSRGVRRSLLPTCSHLNGFSPQVFDILPLCGVLQPYSTHQISFTFFGHCDIIARAKAMCEVEGGPTYEVTLRGEASLISYSFDTKDINFGLQVSPAFA